MKPHVVIAALALGLIACSTGSDGNPASTPFDPFGIEPAGSSGSESTGAKDPQPGTGASIQQLCETFCEHATSACDGNGYCDASTCAGIIRDYPGCVTEIQAYFACAAKAPIECGYYGPQVPACASFLQSIQYCIGYGAPE